MLRIAREHPLTTAMIVAVLLRIPAVIFAQGFMFSDDHYETVSVAYRWLQIGALNPDGLLTWGNTAPGDIARFPLFTLFLFGIMKLHRLFGVEMLDTMTVSYTHLTLPTN